MESGTEFPSSTLVIDDETYFVECERQHPPLRWVAVGMGQVLEHAFGDTPEMAIKALAQKITECVNEFLANEEYN